MTRDDLYQVIYTCSVCGEVEAIDDTSLRRISEEFERGKWLNIPVEVSEDKTDYRVYCPGCAHDLAMQEREARAERDYADYCEVQDSMEFERTARIW